MVKFILGLVVGVGAALVWHDSIRGYLRDNMDPARNRADEVLRTVQQKSEGLLDGAKEHISSTLETARGRIRPVRPESASTQVGG